MGNHGFMPDWWGWARAIMYFGIGLCFYFDPDSTKVPNEIDPYLAGFFVFLGAVGLWAEWVIARVVK